jgi:hypothetical protein
MTHLMRGWLQDTYINNLCIMRLPALYQRPGIVLLVPDLEAVV